MCAHDRGVVLALRRGVSRVALGAWRISPHVTSRLPRSLRETLQAIAGKFDNFRNDGPTDWSTALLGLADRSAARSPIPAPKPAGSTTSAAPSLPSPVATIHNAAAGYADVSTNTTCLLATSNLDVSGMDEVVAWLATQLPKCGVRTVVLHATDTASADGAPTGRLGRALRASGIDVVAMAETEGRQWIEMV